MAYENPDELFHLGFFTSTYFALYHLQPAPQMCSINVIRLSLLAAYGTLEMNLPAWVWVIVSSTSCCIDTVFSLTQPSQSSWLFLHAIKDLHCLSPVALLSTAFFTDSRAAKPQSISDEGMYHVQELGDVYAIFFTQMNILVMFRSFASARHQAKYLQQCTSKWNWKCGWPAV